MATSYNGWPASPDKNEIGIVKFGDAQGFPFPGGVRSGDVFTVLGYVATQLHNRVEPCVNGWCWGYTYKQNVNNPSQLSCHASGTAIDWNAPDHPNGSSGTFTAAQVSTIYDILAEVRGAVSWLQGYDEMHFEIAVSAGELADIAASLPGTGPAPIPPPPEEDMPLTDDDVNRVRDAVWGLMLEEDGMNQPAWAVLVQAHHAAQAAERADEQRPDVLTGQSRDEALAQTRNTVRDLQNNQ